MRRKSVWLTVGTLGLLYGSIAVVLTWLVRREPTFYQALEIQPGESRKSLSEACNKKVIALGNSIFNNDSAWVATFSADEINSYLQEDFIRFGTFESLQSEGLHSPRVAIDGNRIRLAMRYGTGSWQTVVSLDVRLWLVADQPNVVGMELHGLWAGSMPMPAKSLLDSITEAASQNNIEVKWYRNDGNPVAVMRFQADQMRPTVQLQRLQIADGSFTVAGRSLLETVGRPLSAQTE